MAGTKLVLHEQSCSVSLWQIQQVARTQKNFFVIRIPSGKNNGYYERQQESWRWIRINIEWWAYLLYLAIDFQFWSISFILVQPWHWWKLNNEIAYLKNLVDNNLVQILESSRTMTDNFLNKNPTSFFWRIWSPVGSNTKWNGYVHSLGK